jgi:ABC-type phosphate/phosphonate transport system substrate-binding protein
MYARRHGFDLEKYVTFLIPHQNASLIWITDEGCNGKVSVTKDWPPRLIEKVEDCCATLYTTNSAKDYSEELVEYPLVMPDASKPSFYP